MLRLNPYERVNALIGVDLVKGVSAGSVRRAGDKIIVDDIVAEMAAGVSNGVAP